MSTCSNSNRFKTIGAAWIHRFWAINKVVHVYKVVVGSRVIASNNDGHPRMVVIFKTIVINTIVLTKDLYPVVPIVDTRRVVTDDC